MRIRLVGSVWGAALGGQMLRGRYRRHCRHGRIGLAAKHETAVGRQDKKRSQALRPEVFEQAVSRGRHCGTRCLSQKSGCHQWQQQTGPRQVVGRPCPVGCNTTLQAGPTQIRRQQQPLALAVCGGCQLALPGLVGRLGPRFSQCCATSRRSCYSRSGRLGPSQLFFFVGRGRASDSVLVMHTAGQMQM